MLAFCRVRGEDLERSDLLAAARGFELTHSNTNPSPAKPFDLLGIKYGLVRSICALDHAVDLFFGLQNETPENGNNGSSWARVITALKAEGVNVSAAPLPLTSLGDDVAALNRSMDRTEGPVVLAAHAYAGAVIALARPERVKALVYVTALAPDEGEKVADVFYRLEPHPRHQSLHQTAMV